MTWRGMSASFPIKLVSICADLEDVAGLARDDAWLRAEMLR